MKIVYCIHGTYNSGGMERVLANKINYLVCNKGYDITIITTEQKGRKSFFDFHDSVSCIDLGINYSDDSVKGIIRKGLSFWRKRKIHKKKLSEILLKIKPDIVVSMFGAEIYFLPDIADGSKKILEIHFSKFFRMQYGRGWLWKAVDMFRSKQDERMVKTFDRLVVLTNEDKENWKNCNNIQVIYNFIVDAPGNTAELEKKKVIAVGRLTYQKGYERLIKAWKIVAEEYPDWHLDIYGDGELHNQLLKEIQRENLIGKIALNAPVTDIESIYLDSSFLVLSSRYEGMPMVLLEAFSHGLPVVSYACKCGPRDVISDMVDGFLIEEGNIVALADGIKKMISDVSLRKDMGRNALQKSRKFSQKVIMNQWITLFESLVGKK